jgi:hypothetical protein
VKSYIISRKPDGTLQLLAQSLVKGKLIEETFSGGFDIGNASEETKNLALQILVHYYGNDAGGRAEAERKADAFLGAFLLTHAMRPGAQYEVTSDVIDRWTFLTQIPVSAR